ncbi:D-alanyl-D-alanine carboxypeptidase family protein [Lacrimispora saccharolytica]|nr:D-alanyl-D-alanine carboxypeptidase family protein [Lacrimispora saccharolytica]
MNTRIQAGFSRMLAVILCLFLLIPQAQPVLAAEISTNQIANWPAGPEVPTPNAVVMDADTGAILYNKGMDEVRYPASITKVMTALLAIENSSLTDQVTMGAEAASLEVPGNSRIDAVEGEVFTMEQCLHAILLASANGVTRQVAEYIAGSEENFVNMMNERAKELGCTNTHFNNSSGLPDPDHYTTPHDMALILSEAVKNETFCAIEADLLYTIPPTNMTSTPRELRNHHAMLFEGEWYYEGAFAGKTGYTDEAHNTLVTAAKRNDMTLVCVVMLCDNLDYINDTRTLLDYGFNNFSHATLEGTSDREGSVMLTLPNGVSASDTTYSDTENGDTTSENTKTVTRQYYYNSQPVGTAQVTVTSTPTPTASVTDTPSEDASDETGSFFSNPLILAFIIVDLIGVILIIVFAVKRRRRRRRRKSRRRRR